MHHGSKSQRYQKKLEILVEGSGFRCATHQAHHPEVGQDPAKNEENTPVAAGRLLVIEVENGERAGQDDHRHRYSFQVNIRETKKQANHSQRKAEIEGTTNPKTPVKIPEDSSIGTGPAFFT